MLNNFSGTTVTGPPMAPYSPPMGQSQGLGAGLGLGMGQQLPTQQAAYGNIMQPQFGQQDPQAAAVMQQYQQQLQGQSQPQFGQQDPQAAAAARAAAVMQQYQQAQQGQPQPQAPQQPMNRPAMPPPQGLGAAQQVRPEPPRMQAMRNMQRMGMTNRGRFG